MDRITAIDNVHNHSIPDIINSNKPAISNKINKQPANHTEPLNCLLLHGGLLSGHAVAGQACQPVPGELWELPAAGRGQPGDCLRGGQVCGIRGLRGPVPEGELRVPVRVHGVRPQVPRLRQHHVQQRSAPVQRDHAQQPNPNKHNRPIAPAPLLRTLPAVEDPVHAPQHLLVELQPVRGEQVCEDLHFL